jgi:hypothetical protein
MNCQKLPVVIYVSLQLIIVGEMFGRSKYQYSSAKYEVNSKVKVLYNEKLLNLYNSLKYCCSSLIKKECSGHGRLDWGMQTLGKQRRN